MWHIALFLLKSNAELSGLSEHGEICTVDQPSEKCLAVNEPALVINVLRWLWIFIFYWGDREA